MESSVEILVIVGFLGFVVGLLGSVALDLWARRGRL